MAGEVKKIRSLNDSMANVSRLGGNIVKSMSEDMHKEATNYLRNMAEIKLRLEMNRDALTAAKEEQKQHCVS